MCSSSVKDGAIRVATYSRDHEVVVNNDGTIDVFRRPTKTLDAGDQSRAVFESINRRNRDFWERRGGIPE